MLEEFLWNPMGTAYTVLRGNNLYGFLDRIVAIFQLIIPLLIAGAVLFFLWGIKKYITANDGESQVEAIHVITNGVIILFAMISIWGLVNLLITTTAIKPVAPPMQNIRI